MLPVPLRFLLLATTLSVCELAGCGGGGAGGASPSSPVAGAMATVALQNVADPWNAAAPRWRDISNTLYSSEFQTSFSYATGRVTLSYQTTPSAAHFVGHISARGLKPNFAYQIKLAGKPVGGPQGWGTASSYVTASSNGPGAVPVAHEVSGTAVAGDDWTNQQLGYAGRWWDETSAPSTNLTDDYFRANYPAHTVYGYLFLGDFVTDASGNAEADLNASASYHITWQDGQSGAKDVLFGSFSVTQTSYGYAAPFGSSTQTLWYEREAGRPQPVALPSGTYHCRLLITEEAFHGAGGSGGGVWQTVFASEKEGDTSASNDLVFSIR